MSKKKKNQEKSLFLIFIAELSYRNAVFFNEKFNEIGTHGLKFDRLNQFLT